MRKIKHFCFIALLFSIFILTKRTEAAVQDANDSTLTVQWKDENFGALICKALKKEEVIYVNLDGTGNVEKIYAVNIFTDKNITDYGSYSEVKNMNTSDKINYSNGVVTIDNSSEKLYYEGIMYNDTQIPWNISIKYILDGTNLSDLGDYRPGLKALEELNIVSPLKNAKLTKDEIRVLSKKLNIATYKKASFACLATRIPVNHKITNEKLRMVEQAENFLQDNNFSQYRVRIHDDLARIEVDKSEINKFYNDEMMSKINLKFKEIGFKYVTVDLNGYKMGSMN